VDHMGRQASTEHPPAPALRHPLPSLQADRQVAEDFGNLLGEEFFAAGMNTMWGPAMDIARTWHFGRLTEIGERTPTPIAFAAITFTGIYLSPCEEISRLMRLLRDEEIPSRTSQESIVLARGLLPGVDFRFETSARLSPGPTTANHARSGNCSAH
jgi:hypothetical protein